MSAIAHEKPGFFRWKCRYFLASTQRNLVSAQLDISFSYIGTKPTDSTYLMGTVPIPSVRNRVFVINSTPKA